jgi:enoyl-CoA hydratase
MESTPPLKSSTNELVMRSDARGIVTLLLNRPEKRNALSIPLFQALQTHLSALAQQADSVGVVVLRAAGQDFSAGADLAEKDRRPRANYQGQVVEQLANLPQVVIAAVHGHCFTGGLELALACDLIVAREDACFADTHAKWGLSPGWGMSQRLPRRVGTYRARELMFSGRIIDAKRAEAIGLVNECVPADRYETTVQQWASDIVALSWHTHRGNKKLLLQTDGMPLAAALAVENYRSAGVAPDFADRVGERFK